MTLYVPTYYRRQCLVTSTHREAYFVTANSHKDRHTYCTISWKLVIKYDIFLDLVIQIMEWILMLSDDFDASGVSYNREHIFGKVEVTVIFQLSLGIPYKMLSFSLRHIAHTHTHICIYRADSRPAPSQWETSLQINAVSHWLPANLESALYIYIYILAADGGPTEMTNRKQRQSYKLHFCPIIILRRNSVSRD